MFRPLFRNPHLATLAGNFWPRGFDERRTPARQIYYRTAPGTEVLVEENRPAGAPRGHVVLCHGLEGSSRSGYLLSMTQEMLRAGFSVHRLNMRGCGGTEERTTTLYNAGLTDDLRWLAGHLAGQGARPLFLCGYSLGGNVVLKLAGEMGAELAGTVAGVCAVSTPLDLGAATRAMQRPENRLYEWRFILSLRRRYARRAAAHPDLFPPAALDGAWSVEAFDDRVTARAFGFGTAENYYARQSSLRFLAGIRVPTLLVAAEDDPLVPFELYRHPSLAANPALELRSVPHGGHLGFLARGGRRFWLDGELRQWIEGRAEQTRGLARQE